MTKIDTDKVLAVLRKIVTPDARVKEAIAIVEKQKAVFDACRGQLKDNYELEHGYW